MDNIKRIYVEKKEDYAIEAKTLLKNLRENLNIKKLNSVRILNKYDISGITEEEFKRTIRTIFSEPPVDMVYNEEFKIEKNEIVFASEYLPGQYDQRADSAAQCIQITTKKSKPIVRTAKVYVLKGDLVKQEILKIKKYLINPVDSREANLAKPESLKINFIIPDDVKILIGFTDKNKNELEALRKELNLAMRFDDVLYCQKYFKKDEKRDPSITEIKVLDTYWSDHCRHTTFNTKIKNVHIEKSIFSFPIKIAFEKYLKSYKSIYKDKDKDITLMNIATINAKELLKKGGLKDLEISGEINACSIIRDVEIEDKKEEWLIMFKNETHNHPTEIEPFGGAATCLGGAIRDPLSGRSYVFQAMRVTGSGDPKKKIEETLPGKLPQQKITTEAANGYSSYGNQVGLATGMVSEIYDEGYIAKRMEVGAVIGAVPKKNIIRQEPEPEDSIILVGGKTGRDGIGGATGSSKTHTEESIYTAEAEVQKGNPPEERKLQRLFRNPQVTKMIKKSNDFGAGGVSVAVGELTEGIEINLDLIPVKYKGLNGTELAISESQERMAVVVSKENAKNFIRYAFEENLAAVEIAKVTSDKRLKMFWRGKKIVDLSRRFISTNGKRQNTNIFVSAPLKNNNFFKNRTQYIKDKSPDLKNIWLENMRDLNIASQKGLVERFDTTIGAGSVFLPFGGKYQLTPIEAMVAKIPAFPQNTKTGTVMSFGFNPRISKWSPFHGAIYSIVEAIAKIVSCGGNYKSIHFSFQEYFEKLGHDIKKWGKPFSALLGAYYVMKELNLAAIGGKDSMSGTFNDLNVPPTLIAFAVDTIGINKVISPEFKKPDNYIIYIKLERDKYELPYFDLMKKNYTRISELVKNGKILSAQTVKEAGLIEALSKMSFGNKIGFKFKDKQNIISILSPDYGSILVEIDKKEDVNTIFKGINYKNLGKTQKKASIEINGSGISIEEIISVWEEPFEDIFPTKVINNHKIDKNAEFLGFSKRNTKRPPSKIARPRVLIPVFPGTNCEYDTAKAFEKAGGLVDIFVFNNLNPKYINQSLKKLESKIHNSQIIVIPGGFSSGDEPEGAGKFIAAVFRNPNIKDTIMNLLKHRDGLILGICNGFQALIKLGLVPFGEIIEMNEKSPILTFNTIGRHISRMVRTKVTSVLSPWFIHSNIGNIHTIPVSHGEGRFIANEQLMNKLISAGQIATQYVDFNGNPNMDINFNPNGSINAVEGITSPDGRVLGKMCHSERTGNNISKNIPGNKDQKLFESGIDYFR